MKEKMMTRNTFNKYDNAYLQVEYYYLDEIVSLLSPLLSVWLRVSLSFYLYQQIGENEKNDTNRIVPSPNLLKEQKERQQTTQFH